MVQSPRRNVILVTILTLYFSRAQPQWYAADANVIGRVSNNTWLAVVSELGDDLSRATDACRGPGLRQAPCYFLGGSLFGGALLGKHAWVLGLCSVTPYCSFLFAKQSDIAGLLITERPG
jgi:hypothetical protein